MSTVDNPYIDKEREHHVMWDNNISGKGLVVSEIPDKGGYCTFHERPYVICERHLLSTKTCKLLSR